MISGLIHVARPADPDAVDRLAGTLSALIAGVAAGLVGDAVIVAPPGSGPSDRALEAVAEGSGAVLVAAGGAGDPWRAGAGAARREWVLCLEAGDVPREGWIRTLDRFVGTARPEVALGRLRRPHAGLAARLAGRAEGVVGVGRARAGDVVRRERLLAGPDFRPRLKARRLLARLDRV